MNDRLLNYQIGQKVLVINPSKFPIPVNLVLGGTGSDGESQDLLTDPDFGSLITLDFLSYQVEAGYVFEVAYTKAIGSGDTLGLLLRTPNQDIDYHFGGVVVSTAECTANFYENPTVGAVGAPLTVINPNRISSIVNTMDVYLDPTINNNGLFLDGVRFGSGRQGSAATGEGIFILKPNEDYLLLITSHVNGNHATARLQWFEHN